MYSSWKPDSPPPQQPKRKQPTALPRLDVRYGFSDAWARKLFGRFVSSLPAHARATWYYWPASATDGLRTALEDAAVGLLVDELLARGTAVLDAAGGAVSLWKLVQAAGALGREEAARLAHTAASHLPYDTMQAKCRSDYGPWPVWRGVRGGTRFDFKTNRPTRGLIIGSDNAAIARPPAFLDWPGVRAELCRYAGAMKFGGKETFFVVRGMRLLGDDQKDLEGAEVVYSFQAAMGVGVEGPAEEDSAEGVGEEPHALSHAALVGCKLSSGPPLGPLQSMDLDLHVFAAGS